MSESESQSIGDTSESQSIGDTYSGQTEYDERAPSVRLDDVEVYYSSGDPKKLYDAVMSSSSRPVFETLFPQDPPDANNAAAMFTYNQKYAIDLQRFAYLESQWNKLRGAAQSSGRGAAAAAAAAGIERGARAGVLNPPQSRRVGRRVEVGSGGRRTKRSNRKNKRSASKRKRSNRRRSSRK